LTGREGVELSVSLKGGTGGGVVGTGGKPAFRLEEELDTDNELFVDSPGVTGGLPNGFPRSP